MWLNEVVFETSVPFFAVFVEVSDCVAFDVLERRESRRDIFRHDDDLVAVSVSSWLLPAANCAKSFASSPATADEEHAKRIALTRSEYA
jgi:hypothetical protein